MSTVAPYNRDLFTVALMGFTAGYTTANTKVRFNTFGGFMTGNTVKVGISLQQEEWGWAGVYMACILLFALGIVFALFMIQRLGTNAQRAFLLIFMVSFLLVDGIALALKDEDPIYSSLVSSLAAFALGAQNLLSQKSGLIKGNTTFMSGNIQKMAEALWNLATKKGGLKPAEQRGAFLLFLTWIFYVVGGVSGAALAGLFDWSLTPAALLYGAGMASMEADPPKPTPKVATKEAPPASSTTETCTTPPCPARKEADVELGRPVDDVRFSANPIDR